MKKSRIIAIRSIRKAANISRRAMTKGVRLTGKIENKAGRMIAGTDPTLHIHDKVLYEKILSEALPEVVPIHPSLPLIGREPALTILIPSLQKSSFFGGTATALILAAKLAIKKNLSLRIIETIKAGEVEPQIIADFLAANEVRIASGSISIKNLAGRTHNNYGYLDIHPKDVFMATAWWDAYLLEKLPLPGKFVYLVQDYEPIFYNNSDRSALAHSTYLKDSFVAVCNTKFMYDFMKQKGYSKVTSSGLYFEPAVNIGNQVGLTEKKRIGQKKRMFLYGRPSVHRNLFYSAILAINELFATSKLDPNDWELFMAGEDKLPNILLDGGASIKNLGKLPLSDYYQFAKTVDVAVSPMLAPHPNYPTLEFASLGAGVVTTTYENKQDLSVYSDNIVIVDSEIPSLTNAIAKVAEIPYEKRLEAAKTTNLPADWHASLHETVDSISKLV